MQYHKTFDVLKIVSRRSLVIQMPMTSIDVKELNFQSIYYKPIGNLIILEFERKEKEKEKEMLEVYKNMYSNTQPYF